MKKTKKLKFRSVKPMKKLKATKKTNNSFVKAKIKKAAKFISKAKKAITINKKSNKMVKKSFSRFNRFKSKQATAFNKKTFNKKAFKKAVKIKATAIKGNIKETPKVPVVSTATLIRQRRDLLKDEKMRQYLIDIGGEQALAVVQTLIGNMTHEDLSKKIKVNKSEIRMTLYKLHQKGLVNYTRDKDEDSGWYSYFWSIRDGQLMDLYNSLKNSAPAAQTENTEFYACESCRSDGVYRFEDAMDLKFRCPLCNCLLVNTNDAKSE